MATSVVRNRVNSPARWEAALRRALEAGIEIFVSASDGQRFATSSSQLDTIYAVDAHSCSCPAGVSGDPVCMHRAAVRFALGWLALEDREPESAATVDCAGCNGRGWNYYEIDGGRSFPGKETCRRCDGSGQMPVRIVRAARPTKPVANAAA